MHFRMYWAGEILERGAGHQRAGGGAAGSGRGEEGGSGSLEWVKGWKVREKEKIIIDVYLLTECCFIKRCVLKILNRNKSNKYLTFKYTKI